MNFFKYNRIPLLNFPIPVLLGEGKNEAKKDIDISDEENSASYPTPKEGKDITHDLEIVIESISMMGDFRVTQRKECQSLVRRVKILLVLLDEIKELNISISDTALTRLSNLKKALLSAKKLLTTCTESSKIYLALEYEAIMGLFTSTNGKLCRALDAMPYDELGISDEVKEQIELMGHQLKRSKRRTDSQDMELAMDMMVVFGKQDIDRNADIAMKQRLAKKLDLHTMADLEAEALAVRRLAKEKLAGAAAENIQNIVDILNKFKQIAGIEECNVLLDEPKKTEEFAKCNAMEIPLEFLCPITLEIMTDPVIVATGQTYERASIQQWLDSNRRTCPKTGQVLTHLSLAPNYALKNLILQWCEKNNFRPSKKTDTDGAESQSSGESSSNEHKEQIMSLVKDLSSKLDKQRDAAQKLRLLAKENPENRVLIAEFGGIAPLVKLLSYSDSKLREHAVTALLNLSIDDSNKKLISAQGAIPAIIDVLETGSAGAKENAAAALFSLSMLEENKVVVGVSIGIPPLVELLRTGTVRGMRDAVTALFNLCFNHSNKARAIDAGIVRPLLKLLEDKEKGMVDEALSILLLLVSHPQGRQEIAQLTFIETLVNFMKDGTPKNKEGAAAILFELGLNGGSSFLLAALQYGVYEHLVEMTQTGTSRAQRKSGSIMQLMSKYEQIP